MSSLLATAPVAFAVPLRRPEPTDATVERRRIGWRFSFWSPIGATGLLLLSATLGFFLGT